jgi:hypothetical protein
VTRGRRGARRAFALALLFGMALGCASPPTDEEIDAELRQIAKSVRPAGELRVVGLYATSRMDSWAQVAESTAEGRDSTPMPARRLIRAFSQADRRRIAVVTGGPYASYNERIVLDAFDAVRASKLPGLTLVFVSPEPPSDDLRLATQKVGCKVVHRTPAER